ncbi:MAG: GNAT family N-acetyltransferase [Deltaproteobacteria bacterium]|nr:GNAT family N-acetyltransferase [Deltaproteobacteria bacterium]
MTDLDVEHDVEIEFRGLHPEEIDAAVELFLDTLGDLTTRKGLPRPSLTPQDMTPVYRHILRTGIFEIALVDGKMGAICNAVVRDRIWFLSGFWVRPSLQLHGIGKRLLTRVHAEGVRRGADTFFTWSSIDFTAMATYMKFGMLPASQILTFAGAPQALGAVGGYEVAELSDGTALELDEAVRGTRREVDHEFWKASAERREVVQGGRPVGFFYARSGVIGPAAWSDAEHADGVLREALAKAAEQAEEVRLFCTGSNHAAIRMALATGMRLVNTSHLLMTRPFGKMDRYLPSGPSLF